MECSCPSALSQSRKERAWLLVRGRTGREGSRNLLARSTRGTLYEIDRVFCWFDCVFRPHQVFIPSGLDLSKCCILARIPCPHVPKSVLHTTNKEGQHLQSSVLILCENKERLSDTCLKHESKCARQSEYLEKKGTKDKNRSLPPKLCSEMARYQRYVV